MLAERSKIGGQVALFQRNYFVVVSVFTCLEARNPRDGAQFTHLHKDKKKIQSILVRRLHLLYVSALALFLGN